MNDAFWLLTLAFASTFILVRQIRSRRREARFRLSMRHSARRWVGEYDAE